MEGQTNLLIAINVFLFGVVAFFARSIVSKLEEAVISIAHMDKGLAVLSEKFATNKLEVKEIYHRIETIETEIKLIRERSHAHINDLNKIALLQQNCLKNKKDKDGI